jgi:hypothetical protein
MGHNHQQVVHQHQPPVQAVQAVHPVPAASDDDEFTDYAQPGSVAREDINEQVISFDALMNQHKQAPQQQQNAHYQSYNGLKTQNITLHHPYNPNIGQHNLVYNSHFPQQQQQQQYHPMHNYSANPNYQIGHNYSPMSHNYPTMTHNLPYPQQQYNSYNNQVGVGNYWK